MLIGLLNIVPYLSVVGLPAAILLKYLDTLSGVEPQNAGIVAIVVWPSLVYFGVQVLDNWILTPWIQSGQTNLSAATILVSIFIGGALFGVWGLVFAIPVAACFKIFLEEFVAPPLKRWASSH
jgi:predicted PurR-regulated permease PerM